MKKNKKMYTTDSAEYIRFVLLPAAKKRAKAMQKKCEKPKQQHMQIM